MKTTAGQRLREAWSQGTIQIPGVYCPLVARLVERMGFRAVYLSGAVLSASLGIPDIGLVTATEFADMARSITSATTLPLLCDADTGFGEALNVERTVQLFESAGAAGLHLEDQELPKRCGHLSGKSLVTAETMVRKIRAAVAAKSDPEFVIMARTDARGVEGFGLEEAIRRATLYVQAGADAIFPEALRNNDEFAAFARALPDVPLLANMTEFGVSPTLTVDELSQMGYRMVLYPVTTFRTALKATQSILSEIQQFGHQQNRLGDMLTRRELYELLDYSGFESRDQHYFG